MQNGRTVRALHAIVVASLVTAAVYLYVPPFVEVFANFELPLSSRVLMASFHYAFVLPIAAAAATLLPSPTAPWLKYVVPCTYAVGVALIAFVVYATYAPVFAYGEGK